MRVREATTADHGRVRQVVAAAFDDGGAVATLLDDLRRADRVVLELVAEDEAGIVGHVALDRCWVDDEAALVEALVLSPLAVVPSRQGTGTGTLLVEAALAAATGSGSDYVFLEGDPGYYGARGFGPASTHGFLRPSDRIPGPAFQVAALRDRGVTGRVVYPDVFWAHDATGLRGEVLARVRESIGE